MHFIWLLILLSSAYALPVAVPDRNPQSHSTQVNAESEEPVWLFGRGNGTQTRGASGSRSHLTAPPQQSTGRGLPAASNPIIQTDRTNGQKGAREQSQPSTRSHLEDARPGKKRKQREAEEKKRIKEDKLAEKSRKATWSEFSFEVDKGIEPYRVPTSKAAYDKPMAWKPPYTGPTFRVASRKPAQRQGSNTEGASGSGSNRPSHVPARQQTMQGGSLAAPAPDEQIADRKGKKRALDVPEPGQRSTPSPPQGQRLKTKKYNDRYVQETKELRARWREAGHENVFGTRTRRVPATQSEPGAMMKLKLRPQVVGPYQPRTQIQSQQPQRPNTVQPYFHPAGGPQQPVVQQRPYTDDQTPVPSLLHRIPWPLPETYHENSSLAHALVPQDQLPNTGAPQQRRSVPQPAPPTSRTSNSNMRSSQDAQAGPSRPRR